MKRLSLWILIACCAVVAMPAMAEEQFTAGEWEFVVRYDLIGVPQTFPSYTLQQCLSAKEPYPDISQPGSECRSEMQGRFGRTVTWTLDCSTEWEMVQGMGRLHFWKGTAIGDVHLQVLNPHNPPQPMLYHLEGKLLGPCSTGN